MQGKTFLVIGVVTCILLIVFAVGLFLFILDLREKRKSKETQMPEIAKESSLPEQPKTKNKRITWNVRPLAIIVTLMSILGIVAVCMNKNGIERVVFLGRVSFIAFFVFLILLVAAAKKGWGLKKGIIATCSCLAIFIVCIAIYANDAKKAGVASVYAPESTADLSPVATLEIPEPTQELYIVKNLTEGDVIEKIKQISTNIKLEEKYNKNVGNTELIIRITPDGTTPLEQARAYLNIYLRIKTECYDVLSIKKYSKIICYFSPNTDKTVLFWIELEEKNGQYLIGDATPAVLLGLMDKDYLSAIHIALGELTR